MGRSLLLALIVVLALAGTGALGADGGEWFPQEHAHAFYVTKGLIGTVAVVLILVHMSIAWPNVATSGQRLRYLVLLMLTVLVASASTEQLSTSAPVTGRNVGGLIAAALVIVAMVVSIQQDRRR